MRMNPDSISSRCKRTDKLALIAINVFMGKVLKNDLLFLYNRE